LRPNKKALGAKKASKSLNFEEAERKAKEEEARRHQAEQELEQQELEERQRQFQQAAAANKSRQEKSNAYNNNSGAVSSNGNMNTDDAMDRLGMGFGKMGGFGFDPSSAPSSSSSASTSKKPASNNGGFGSFGAMSSDYGGEDEGDASKRFATAKGISSDQYFGRGAYDEQASSEAKERLRNFEGKTGFGSSDYYGRDETGGDRRGSSDMMGESAKELANKFAALASDDIQNIKRFVGAGSAKLGEMLSDIQQRYN
jgi:ADP-ribosylation factor GTPase-activating protein 2/3